MAVCSDRTIVPEQQAAAAHRGSNARLLAGPGTGKTRTIVDLVLSLVANGDAEAGQIPVPHLHPCRGSWPAEQGREALGEDAALPQV